MVSLRRIINDEAELTIKSNLEIFLYGLSTTISLNAFIEFDISSLANIAIATLT